ncbi:MAG: class I SAM-dependent methyltransferase [Theionarchaea archaeon]|nr:class I SAM-dependent methyltransferase [Theionarchaea archaeon]MBU7000291.1 class I SAM-dependent methyltransferase [Theionarchaea archaeon]
MSFWNEERARFYRDTWGPPTNPKKWGNLDRMKIPVSLLKGETVLDVGCGLGHLYHALKGQITQYVGVDASPFMLEKARKFFPEADFREGDIYNLSEFPLADTVYSISLLIHLSSVEEPINQLWSRTRKRCVLLIPLGKKEEIKEPEPGLIIHQTSFKTLDSIMDSLPDKEKSERIFWTKNHYFIVLDKKIE